MADLEVVPRVDEEHHEVRSGRARNYLQRNPRFKWIVAAVAASTIVNWLAGAGWFPLCSGGIGRVFWLQPTVKTSARGSREM